MKSINIRELLWRVPIALAITATAAFFLMRIAGGGAMFCIDPPAADPGWEWKVPLAWAIIYGVSAFLGILVGSLRPRSLTTPIITSLATVAVFFVARRWPHSSEQLRYMEQEFAYGFPSLYAAGIIACAIGIMTKKTEPTASGYGSAAPEP